jgi:hypothetical protein
MEVICLHGCRQVPDSAPIELSAGQTLTCPTCGGAIALLAPDHAARAAARRRSNTYLAAAMGAAFVIGCAIVSVMLITE